MSLTLWQFISQGGTVKTTLGQSVNNIVLIANTNPYPISGKVVWSGNHSVQLNWAANGVPQNAQYNQGLELQPVATFTQYVTYSNSTLLTVNSYSQWANTNNRIS